ncbi:hypothetical protein GGR50DRAFT_663831 [Xylaria sp. CBS 124048]|nr:hypothetical protein GGR50DRAFT_663831 [Xylaria sp. CBS 124048]
MVYLLVILRLPARQAGFALSLLVCGASLFGLRYSAVSLFTDCTVRTDRIWVGFPTGHYLHSSDLYGRKTSREKKKVITFCHIHSYNLTWSGSSFRLIIGLFHSLVSP